MKHFVLTFVASWAVIFSLPGCSPKSQSGPVVAAEPAQEAVFFLQATRNTPVFEDITVDEYALLNERMPELLERIGFAKYSGYLVPMRLGPTVVIERRAQRLESLSEIELKAFVDRFFAE